LKFRRLRIAVVDDEEHVRKALERLLRGAGFEVETYACGADFLARLAEHAPDCLVLDLHMSGLSGFDVQDAMRARGSRVPVVVLTGHESAGIRGHALAAGAFAYLRKPVDGPELIQAITRAGAAMAS
jgi:two-component system response regulator FixJ